LFIKLLILKFFLSRRFVNGFHLVLGKKDAKEDDRQKHTSI